MAITETASKQKVTRTYRPSREDGIYDYEQRKFLGNQEPEREVIMQAAERSDLPGADMELERVTRPGRSVIDDGRDWFEEDTDWERTQAELAESGQESPVPPPTKSNRQGRKLDRKASQANQKGGRNRLKKATVGTVGFVALVAAAVTVAVFTPNHEHTPGKSSKPVPAATSGH